MLTKALVLTDGEADLLSRALEEVKTKTFEESQISLDDLGALNTLVSYFMDAERLEPDKEARQISVNPLSKRLFLGHIIGREGGLYSFATRRMHVTPFGFYWQISQNRQPFLQIYWRRHLVLPLAAATS
jgi:hypothetical protein